jgi:catechol 2,3-dioxygenase-like lactoylglutathione lyase family enzyme
VVRGWQTAGARFGHLCARDNVPRRQLSTLSRRNEFRTGLDHLTYTVSSRDELEAWQALLAEKGIPFSPIAESPIGTLVVLRDPDNIQLELWLPLEQ